MKNEPVFLVLCAVAGLLIVTRSRPAAPADVVDPKPSSNGGAAAARSGLMSDAKAGSPDGLVPSRNRDEPGAVVERSPEEKVVHWIELFRSIQTPELDVIRDVLRSNQVDAATSDLVAPRIFHDLVRLRLFEEFEQLALARLTNPPPAEGFGATPEGVAESRRHDLNVASVWRRFSSNYLGQLRYRLADEAGIGQPDDVLRISELRPPGPLQGPPDFDPARRKE